MSALIRWGGPPQVIMTDGEGAIKTSVPFQKHFTEHHITYTPSRGHPVFAERMIRAFKGDGRRTDQARPTVDRLDISNIIIL